LVDGYGGADGEDEPDAFVAYNPGVADAFVAVCGGRRGPVVDVCVAYSERVVVRRLEELLVKYGS
jgi:hypothetical protein